MQLYRTATFLALLSMSASDHLFNKCDQKIRQVKNQTITHQIPEENLKQLSLLNYCLVFKNDWSVLYLASYKSRTHYSIDLKFPAVELEQTLIKAVSAFFLTIRRSFKIKRSVKMRLNNGSWREIFAGFWKTEDN